MSEIVWTHFSVRRTLRDAALIVVGSLVYAIGIDCFEVPNGLAAGDLPVSPPLRMQLLAAKAFLYLLACKPSR